MNKILVRASTVTPCALLNAEEVRSQVVSLTSEKIREDYSQYLTPYQTARLAASMFSDACGDKPLRCLDLGAGTGMLSVALAERYGGRVELDCLELDPKLATICDQELSRHGIEHRIQVVDALEGCISPLYDRVILNPPYKKMAADDFRQKYLPTKSPNLYCAFLMIAICALAKDGECVAIIPRSWMNGQYFRAFREWALTVASLDCIHIYGSRSEIFSDTNVLQETMIVRFSKRIQGEFITVSESHDKNGKTDVQKYPFSSLVAFDDDFSIRVTATENNVLDELPQLKSVGLCASTGKVVDFRSRDVLHEEYADGFNRLIYACNFTAKGFEHPVPGGKPQWIDCSTERVSKQCIPTGSYVVVKRFSSKEENRRIKAYPLDLDTPEALENHLNYVHAGTSRNTVPLDPILARGLTLWFSFSEVEAWFRARSGSTQVNASDLNAMPVPIKTCLYKLGKYWKRDISQREVDELCRLVLR